MTELTDLVGLIRLEDTLGRMDERLARMEGDQRSMLKELRAHKALISGALHSQAIHEASLANLTNRVERIERRLELREDQ